MKSLAATFSLPRCTAWQHQILDARLEDRDAYVWGGTSDATEMDFGVTARGGYDCSGFVWRVYKLQSYADEGNLASAILGRTTYDDERRSAALQADQVRKLQPADVIFFGADGPQLIRRPDHPHGDLRRQRLVHPLVRLRRRARAAHGWYRTEFAWGRRPLREAGLEIEA